MGQSEIKATYVVSLNQDITYTNEEAPIGEGTTNWDFGAFPTNQLARIIPQTQGILQLENTMFWKAAHVMLIINIHRTLTNNGCVLDIIIK